MVMLGDNMLHSESESVTLIPVQDIIFPPSFDIQTMRSDIALALLYFPVNYSSLIQPVCLPGEPFQVKNGTACWMTGWGQQNEIGESVWQDAEVGRPGDLGLVICRGRGGLLAGTGKKAGEQTDREYMTTVLGVF